MYIGIDAGGTKTDVCICGPTGSIIARSITAGVNAARSGPENAARYIAAKLESLQANGFRLYAGVAGAGSPELSAALTAALHAQLPYIKHITVASDAFNALNGEIGLGDGIALIAGTGSSAFVRINGTARQVGGRGYLIDDAGSGYWTGRECLNAAYRAIDGRGPATSLTDAIEEFIGVPLADAIPRIYEGGSAYVASFAPLVFAHAENGDPVAKRIAENCAAELTLHLKACISGTDTPPRICVASGGMFRAEYLRNKLAESARDMGIKIIFPSTPPVCGAVVAAAGSAADTDFIKTLKNELRG